MTESYIEHLDHVLEDIQKLKIAKELLDEIWSEMICNYLNVSDKLRYKIQDYYEYDDSE